MRHACYRLVNCGNRDARPKRVEVLLAPERIRDYFLVEAASSMVRISATASGLEPPRPPAPPRGAAPLAWPCVGACPAARTLVALPPRATRCTPMTSIGFLPAESRRSGLAP